MQIGTHSGSSHADDTVGVLVLLFLNPEASVVRSRDPAILEQCEFLVDVGGQFNPATNRFDHHQKGFSERRPNRIPYAGAGLVWASYGDAFVRKAYPSLSDEQVATIAAEVDARLICHIDAVDSGVNVPGPIEFGLSAILGNFNAAWTDVGGDDDARFMQGVAFATTVLLNLVRVLAAEQLAAALVRAAPTLADGQVLVLDTPRLPYDPVVVQELPRVMFVVYPESRGAQYQVRVVPRELGKYEARKDLPAAWAGLRDKDLAHATGVPDAVFCHNGRFICGAESREGAIALAQLALR